MLIAIAGNAAFLLRNFGNTPSGSGIQGNVVWQRGGGDGGGGLRGQVGQFFAEIAGGARLMWVGFVVSWIRRMDPEVEVFCHSLADSEVLRKRLGAVVRGRQATGAVEA